jgi:hypothetical protein
MSFFQRTEMLLMWSRYAARLAAAEYKDAPITRYVDDVYTSAGARWKNAGF